MTDAHGNTVQYIGNMGELLVLFAIIFLFIAVATYIWRR